MENLGASLSLLGVGMITVFIILCLVVLIGNVVIRLTNRFIPVKEAVIEKHPKENDAVTEVQSKKLVAIVSAIDVVTQGRGTVQSIRKK